MAPSRRKGASKAAVAAAARRQWKVGDLVLAKVKGFPAWPATVSEPKAWGYKSDTKKILVYFFGTKQIAFCNPVDVEPFTEEKKRSLQVKRPGRSADFLRAVQEIVDSFEKLREQSQANEPDCTGVPLENATANNNSFHNSVLSTATSNARLNNSASANEEAKSGPAVENGDVPKDSEAPQDTGNSQEPSKESLVPDETQPKMDWAWKTRPSQPQAVQEVKPSVRSFQSSLRYESSQIVNEIGSSDDHSNCANLELQIGSFDRYVRRNKRRKKRSDPLTGNIVEATLWDSKGALEASRSVGSMADCESSDEDSAIDSHVQQKQSEHMVMSHKEDNHLSKGLDFHLNTVILKKKRKPGRKRASIDVAESVAQPDSDAVKDVPTLLPSYTECHDRNSKEDGDEHLPLVKRARVRMEKTSSEDEQLEVLIVQGEISSETNSNISRQINTPMDVAVDNGPEKCSLNVNGSLVYSSPSDSSPGVPDDKSLVWKARKGQAFNCSYDGEAALPPSKRLHRALEAMSANAAEEGQLSLVSSSDMKEDMNGCRDGSPIIVSHTTSKHEGDQSGHEVLSNCSDPRDDAHAINTSSDPSAFEKHGSVDSNVPKILAETVNTGKDDCNEGNVEELAVSPSAKTLAGSNDFAGASISVVEVSSLKLNNCGREESNLDQCFLNQLPVEDDKKVERVTVLHDSNNEGCDGSRLSVKVELRSDPIPEDDLDDRFKGRDGTFSSQDNKNFKDQEPSGETASQNCEQPADERLQSASMCDVVKGSIHAPVVVRPTSPAVDVTASPRPLCLTSVSAAGHFDQAVSASSIGVNTLRRFSPFGTTVAVSDISDTQHDECCALDTNSHGRDPVSDPCLRTNSNPTVSCCAKTANKTSDNVEIKAGNRSSNNTETKTVLVSLEETLGTLTRTKESIGKATRIAIDCAKFGNASEVVEILACCLEREPSLYKRIDLFFLVDSIAQCSRGLKGSIRDEYPSAIQAALPRLLSAAAPGGNIARENRRQCLKVLKVWQDRRILLDSVLCQHIRDLDSQNSSSTGGYARRTSRTERSFDDPIREMEGMNVDEYGSNSTFQIPGFSMPRMVKVEDDESDSDEENFEAVTPEHETGVSGKDEASDLPATEKHRHILEDVDGELEMEDVSPSCEVQTRQTLSPRGAGAAHVSDPSGQNFPSFPPLPCDIPSPAPPLPKSPPPLPPPPPPPPPTIALPPAPPLPPPPLVMPHSAEVPHVGIDSRDHINRHNVQEAMPPHNPAPRISSQMQMTESSASCSYNTYPITHGSVRHGNDPCQTDPLFHHNPYHLRPPTNPASANQFMYFQPEQRIGPQQDAPMPSYSERPRLPPPLENGHFYGDSERNRSGAHEYAENWRAPMGSGHPYGGHERHRSGAHESAEGWRFPRPPYHGSNHTDKSRGYAAPYPDSFRESNRTHDPGWGFHPRPVPHGYHGPGRNFPEGPAPMEIRAPGYWPPR